MKNKGRGRGVRREMGQFLHVYLCSWYTNDKKRFLLEQMMNFTFTFLLEAKLDYKIFLTYDYILFWDCISRIDL